MDQVIDTTVDETGRAVLTVTGSVDLESRMPLLAAGRTSLAAASCAGLVLDLAGVDFLDSTGIGAMIDLSHDASARGVSFAVRNPSSRVARILAVVGLSERWTEAEPAPESESLST